MSLSIWIPQKKHNLLISKRIIIILQYDNTLLNEIPVNKYTDKSSAEIKKWLLQVWDVQAVSEHVKRLSVISTPCDVETELSCDWQGELAGVCCSSCRTV